MSVDADAIYRQSLVIDGIGPQFWYEPDSQRYLEQVVASGLTAFNHTMVTPYDYRPASLEDLVKVIGLWEKRSQEHSDLLLIARSAEDILTAKREGKVAIIFGLQNGWPIGNDPNVVRSLYRLGVRIIGLAYQQANLLGSGCMEPHDGGLTALGREVVSIMNDVGMLVCGSHAGPQTGLDIMRASRSPAVFSHANVRAVAGARRNLTDEQIDALAENGGVIGVAAWAPLVSTELGGATAGKWLEHIDYLVKRIGVDHVGIAMDLADNLPENRRDLPRERQTVLIGTYEDRDDHLKVGQRYPPELDHVSKWPNVARLLAGHGYSAEDIGKIIGGNFHRVFGQVWRG